MILERFITPGMGENTYLIGQTGRVIMIDPGMVMPRLDRYIDEQGLELLAIVLTHGHADHIGGVEHYRDKYGVPVYVPQADDEMIRNPRLNLSAGIAGQEIAIEGAVTFQDGDQLKLGDLTVDIIHTPGHTKGSSCLLILDQLFSGDTLFKMGVGRWDLYGGDGQQLMASIKNKLFTLPDYPVHPGHGVATSIAYERQRNPFIT